MNPPLDGDLEADILFDDRPLVVAGACSPWARRRKIAIEELMHEPWVHIPQDNPVNAYIAASLQARGLALPSPVVSTYSMHVRNYLLATGRFIAVLWEWTLRFNASGSALKVLPVDLGFLAAGRGSEAQEPDSEPGRPTLHRACQRRCEIDEKIFFAVSESGQQAVK